MEKRQEIRKGKRLREGSSGMLTNWVEWQGKEEGRIRKRGIGRGR